MIIEVLWVSNIWWPIVVVDGTGCQHLRVADFMWSRRHAVYIVVIVVCDVRGRSMVASSSFITILLIVRGLTTPFLFRREHRSWLAVWDVHVLGATMNESCVSSAFCCRCCYFFEEWFHAYDGMHVTYCAGLKCVTKFVEGSSIWSNPGFRLCLWLKIKCGVRKPRFWCSRLSSCPCLTCLQCPKRI